MLPENLIHPAIVDFLIFGCGPWDDDLMAPLGPSDPPWHGSIPRLSCSRERYPPIPYGAPNAAAHIERFMGSLKRECLNHFIFLSEDHLRRTVSAYITYYNGGRPHQGIEGIPECGPGLPRATLPATGEGSINVVARPVLGGLHHDYRLAA